MTDDINTIMSRLPEHMRRNFQDNFTGKQTASAAPITETRGGALAMAALELAEAAQPQEPAAPVTYQGKITPGIFSERGDELSVWRNGHEVAVQLRCRTGYVYYGQLVPALNAEGGFDLVYADEEDRAFVRHTIRDVVDAAKLGSLTPEGGTGPAVARDDFNYCHFATALWSNPSRAGAAVHRAFLVFEWGQAGNNWYPKNAILFDGDKERLFMLSRHDSTSIRAPQWSGQRK